MNKLNINQWAEEDRPREKMMQKGAEALTDAELLAILIGSGNTEESAVALMQRVLAEAGNNLHRLGKWQVRDFARFKGLGPAKSISIMAALELGKRRTLQERPERPTIRSSQDIYELFHPLLCDLAHGRILGAAAQPGRARHRQDTHQPRRPGPDHGRRAHHPARSPAGTRHAAGPGAQPPFGQHAPQPGRCPPDPTVRDAAKLMNIHVLDHVIVRRHVLQLQRRGAAGKCGTSLAISLKIGALPSTAKRIAL